MICKVLYQVDIYKDMATYIVNAVYLSYNKNPNPSPIGTRFGFLLFGAGGVIGFSRKYRKIAAYNVILFDDFYKEQY